MIAALRAWLTPSLAARGDPPLRAAVVVGIDRDPSAKVTILLFGEDGRAHVVAKVARNAHAERALVHEHAMLGLVRSRCISSSLTRSIPEPLGLERVTGRLALATTAVGGDPMMQRFYKPGHTADATAVWADFEAAGDWLGRFHQETRTERVTLDAAVFEAVCGPVIGRYRTEIGWDDTERALFDGVRRRVSDLTGCSVPLTGVHGDYWVGNLLADGRRVSGVVDWECSRASALPFADIFKFPTSYGFYLDRAYPNGVRGIRGHAGRDRVGTRWARYGTWPNLAGFAYAFFGEGWFPSLVRATIETHLSDLGVPPEATAIFLPVFLAEQATMLPDPAFRAGYRSVLHGLWAERSNGWWWHDATRVADAPAALRAERAAT